MTMQDSRRSTRVVRPEEEQQEEAGRGTVAEDLEHAHHGLLERL